MQYKSQQIVLPILVFFGYFFYNFSGPDIYLTVMYYILYV